MWTLYVLRVAVNLMTALFFIEIHFTCINILYYLRNNYLMLLVFLLSENCNQLYYKDKAKTNGFKEGFLSRAIIFKLWYYSYQGNGRPVPESSWVAEVPLLRASWVLHHFLWSQKIVLPRWTSPDTVEPERKAAYLHHRSKWRWTLATLILFVWNFPYLFTECCGSLS